MLIPGRLRRTLLLLLALLASGLALFLIAFPAPDLSDELELLRRISDLNLRLKHSEKLLAERKHDLQGLFRQFSKLAGGGDNSGKLGPEAEALASGGAMNWTYDLSLPGIHHFLPHTVDNPASLQPAFKLSSRKDNSKQVSMVMGIPTVRRDHQSYLSVTLKSIFENLAPEEAADALVIVFVAETDRDYVLSVADEIRTQFPAQLESGLLEVVSPPAEYYPDMSALRATLGDEPERVVWRSKQNLDYAFLMMYAGWRGTFYVQLEDDVLTKPGFLSTMRQFALDRTAQKQPWFVIDYCQLGFIGKLFRGSDLPTLVQFFLMFYNDKPVDWLLENVLQTMVCKLDQDLKKCKKEKAKLWVHYKPSLFQHIGTHSSLKGKLQKLKDKQFGKIAMFVPHSNPPATIETAIKHYRAYSLTRAYHGESFYWGLVPQSGDTIDFRLTPPVPLASFRFVSGNAEHPSDKFGQETTIEIRVEEDGNKRVPEELERTQDGMVVVGRFGPTGVAAGELGGAAWGRVSHLRLAVHETSENWVILSEMHVKVAEGD